MLAVEQEGRLRLITQPDHARFAAELLSLWRADGLPRHPRRQELLFAVREHDNGWWEADAAPRVDARRGRPFTYRTLPGEVRREIWERGTCRYLSDRPYAALLIVEHALALHRRRSTAPAWRDFGARLEERRRLLLEVCGIGPAELSRDYPWLALADRLSLAVCEAWSRPADTAGRRARLAGDTLYLSPFPLAGATTFEIPCRRLAARSWADDADLGGELATARWERITVRVAPPP